MTCNQCENIERRVNKRMPNFGHNSLLSQKLCYYIPKLLFCDKQKIFSIKFGLKNKTNRKLKSKNETIIKFDIFSGKIEYYEM